MNILITGANGQLGNSIRDIRAQYPGFRFDFTDVEDLDITRGRDLDDYFAANPVDYVVNCAAYTAVDKAEEEVETATLINETAVMNLAQCAEKFDFTLIHISTDYVFSGSHHRPYTENDRPDPKSVYSHTKHAGEFAVINYCSKGIVLRTSWLYSEYGNNFVKTIRRLASERDEIRIIYDQVGTPTYAGDLAMAILEIIRNNYREKGIFHFSNEGVASWYDLAVATVQLSNLQCRVVPIRTEEYPLPARRPYYSLMSKQKFRDTFEYEIPHWRDSLEICIRNLAEADK